MKKIVLLLFIISYTIFAQQPYYSDVDLTLSGISLKNELATKIINTHVNNLSYNEAREALKIIDLDPGQNTNILMIYGFSNSLCPNDSGNDDKHRRRNKTFFDTGTADPCLWNREHTYPKALGTPNLGTSGPGSDVHHLRAADKKRNGSRDNKLFSAGSGNSGALSSSKWYPGDEWKGDIARMMMYMYLRYGSQCLPNSVGNGNPVANDTSMIDLFLQWNAEDPVSTYEESRNNYLELTSNQYGQGNRNPFIDNPYLATRIWGGTNAEDIWGIYLAADDLILENNIKIYPNPAVDKINIKLTDLYLEDITIYSILGKKIISTTNKEINIKQLNAGIYFIEVDTNKGKLTRKLVKK